MKLSPWKVVLGATLCCFFTGKLFAQQLKLGVQPTILDKDALLELNSDKQGLLLPRVPKVRITAGGSLFGAKPGMLVYVVDESSLYLKKITGWEKIADFANFTAGTGMNIDAVTGEISNTGVISFNSRNGSVTPAEGDYNLDLLSDVMINTSALANNQVLSFDLTSGKWINKTILTSIATTAPLTGTGTAASPLAISPGSAEDQVLKWDGTNWIAAAPATTVTASPLTGAGTAASPLSIASGSAANQYLKWDGFNWNASTIPAPVTKLPLTGDGTATSPLALTDGTTVNDVLKWDGTNWVAGAETTGSRKLSINPGVGVKQVIPAIQQDLTADRSWTIDIDNATALWNANKLSGYNVSAAAPATNNVLVFNGTQWEPKASAATGLTSIDLTMPDIFSTSGTPLTTNGTIGVSLAAQGAAKFFVGPVSGANAAPAFRSIVASDLPDLSAKYIQNSGGLQTGSFNISGTGKVGAAFTLGDALILQNMTQGSVFFAGNGGVVTQNNTKFFWSNSNNRLGIGTGAPGNTLEVAAPTTTSPTTNTSGLRLTNLAGKTGDAATATVLSVNSAGDVILTKNAAQNNWLITGNTGIDPNNSFLGTNDDVKMVIKSNGQSMLEFGRRLTLDLMDKNQNPDGLYSDPNQKVTLLKSALQFESSSEFYQPMFFVNADGNFRMKGSAAKNDFFEFGATGTNNNGGFEFIVGDDGDEPIIFKSYYYSPPVSTEMMRIQRGKVGIGLTAEPEKTLHVNAKNDAIRLQSLATTTSTNNLLAIDGNGDVKQISKASLGATVSMSPNTGQNQNSNSPLNVAANASMVKITNTGNIYIYGISINGGMPSDGQVLTIYNNNTSGNVYFANNSGNSSSGTRILTLGNNTLQIDNPGSVTLTYSGEDNAWVVTSYMP